MGIITDLFLPLALAFIMFSLGLGLTGEDFSRVVRQPKDFFIGLTCQIILLPIVALVLLLIIRGAYSAFKGGKRRKRRTKRK